jgi:hypothetical protein
VTRGDRAHLEIVGEEHPVVAQLAAEEVGRDAARKRGGHAGVDRLAHDVRAHQRVDTGANRGSERRELDRIETCALVEHDREIEVAVDRGVAVTGEVLAAREHAARGETARERQPQHGARLGRAGERSVADDRVRRVRVDVEHGREVHRHAEVREATPHDLARALDDLLPRPPEHSHRRQGREGRLEPLDAPSLLVERDDRGELAVLRGGRGHLRRQRAQRLHRREVAAEEDGPGEVAALERGARRPRERRAVEADDEELSDVCQQPSLCVQVHRSSAGSPWTPAALSF